MRQFIKSGDRTYEWGEFEESLIRGFGFDEQHYEHWIAALCALMSVAFKDEVITMPGLPLLIVNEQVSPKRRFVYRPSLHSAERYVDGREVYQIVLTEIPREIDVIPDGDDKDMGDLHLMVSIGRMTRWGALEPFVQELAVLIAMTESRCEQLSRPSL